MTGDNDEDEYEESDSDTISSYDSDDDEAHVAHHYSRKSQSNAQNKRTKKKIENGSSLFKPHEIDQWDDNQIMDEQAAMLKQLAGLMMGAVAHSDMTHNANSQDSEGGASKKEIEIEGMSHKRQNTLKTLIDVTKSPNPAPHHELKKSLSNARKFSIGDLQSVEEEQQYDPEIFKYLSELVGNESSSVPLTPSTRSVMKDLFVDAMNDDEISINLSSANSNSADSHSGYHHSAQYSASHSDVSQLSDTYNESKQNDDDENVIESMEQGTTLVCFCLFLCVFDAKVRILYVHVHIAQIWKIWQTKI